MIITALKSTVESLLADRVAPRDVEGVEGILPYHTSTAIYDSYHIPLYRIHSSRYA